MEKFASPQVTLAIVILFATALGASGKGTSSSDAYAAPTPSQGTQVQQAPARQVQQAQPVQPKQAPAPTKSVAAPANSAAASSNSKTSYPTTSTPPANTQNSSSNAAQAAAIQSLVQALQVKVAAAQKAGYSGNDQIQYDSSGKIVPKTNSSTSPPAPSYQSAPAPTKSVASPANSTAASSNSKTSYPTTSTPPANTQNSSSNAAQAAALQSQLQALQAKVTAAQKAGYSGNQQIQYNSSGNIVPKTNPPTSSAPTISSQSAPSSQPTVSYSIPASGLTHTVQKGETLAGIALNNNTTTSQLLALNPQCRSNPNLLQIGQQINLSTATASYASTPVGNAAPSNSVAQSSSHVPSASTSSLPTISFQSSPIALNNQTAGSTPSVIGQQIGAAPAMQVSLQPTNGTSVNYNSNPATQNTITTTTSTAITVHPITPSTYPLLSQTDSRLYTGGAVYMNTMGYEKKKDGTVAKEGTIGDNACLATVYAMIEQGHYKNSDYKVSAAFRNYPTSASLVDAPNGTVSGAIPPPNLIIGKTEPLNTQTIINQFDAGKPVILKATDPSGPHFLLATGTTSISGKTSLVVNDPWTGKQIFVPFDLNSPNAILTDPKKSETPEGILNISEMRTVDFTNQPIN